MLLDRCAPKPDDAVLQGAVPAHGRQGVDADAQTGDVSAASVAHHFCLIRVPPVGLMNCRFVLSLKLLQVIGNDNANKFWEWNSSEDDRIDSDVDV